MITIIRHNQRWLLLIIAIMTIIAFAFLYDNTDTEQLGANRVGEMYGKTLYRIDVDRVVRLQQLASILGMNDFLELLTVTARSQEEILDEFVWNLLVLRHESAELWVRPTDPQILEAIQELPALQRNGQFDSNLYLQFMQEQLAPRGLTERHLEDLIRDSLALQRIRDITASPLTLNPLELEDSFRVLQRVDVLVHRLPNEIDPQEIQVSDKEIETFFEDNRDALQTPVYRKIQFVRHGLNEEQKALTGRERIEVLQSVADGISALHEKVVEEERSLAEVGDEAGFVVETSQFFDSNGFQPSDDPSERGDPVDLPEPVVAEAFRLRHGQPLSEIVQSGDTFYVLHWEEEREARPLTLEEIRPKIVEELRSQKASEATLAKARELREKVVQASDDADSLVEVAEAAGLEVQSIDAIEPWQQTMDEKNFFARASMSVEEGKTGQLERSPSGYYFLTVVNREPVDEELLAEVGDEFRTGIMETKRNLLFLEWLRISRERANLRFFATRS